jgi:hypothetical protein
MMSHEATLGRNSRSVSIAREVVLHKLRCDTKLYPLMLEKKFPHVLEKIVTLWESSAGEEYLNDLLKPSYSGGRYERAGFPSQAWDEIYNLLVLYQKRRTNRAAGEDNETELNSFSLFESFLNMLGKDKDGRG